MNTFRTVLVVAVLAPLLAACAPSPDKVCDHVMELMKKKLGNETDAMSEEQIDKIRTGCVDDAKKHQERDRKDYARRAKCMMGVESLEEMRECEKPQKADAKQE